MVAENEPTMGESIPRPLLLLGARQTTPSHIGQLLHTLRLGAL